MSGSNRGNIRVVVDDNGRLLQATDYLAFGLPVTTLPQPAVVNRLYEGNEFQNFRGLGWTDNTARRLDNILCRFTAPDPLAEKYPDLSPYASRANSPFSAIDLDGNLVIFINGFHGGDGGSKDYWDNGKFADAVMNHLNDHHALYIDGSMGGAISYGNLDFASYYSSNRKREGEKMAETYANKVISMIVDKNGKVKETIKIITHSMGAAYAKGAIKVLLEKLKERGIPSGVIEFEADFAPFQPYEIAAVDGVPTLQFSHSKDKFATNIIQYGARKMDTSQDLNQSHRIDSFYQQIINLPAGEYKVENGIIVRK